MTVTPPSPSQSVLVYQARDFRVAVGANQGDAISFLAELVLDDVYELETDARPRRLALHTSSDSMFRVAEDSAIGAAGAVVHLDCTLHLMSPDGETSDALLLVEVDTEGHVNGIYLLPLAPLAPRVEYALVGAERDTARAKFAQIACVSFTRGTHITLSTGRQVPIEDIRAGDRVLTRDTGAPRGPLDRSDNCARGRRFCPDRRHQRHVEQ